MTLAGVRLASPFFIGKKMQSTKKLVMASWEIGHGNTSVGAKVGGMGLVLQELPLEMAKYAASTHRPLEIEILSPCFRFYDFSNLNHEGTLWVPHFNLHFEVFSHVFPECRGHNVKHIYFWNESILGNFGAANYPQSIYPGDSWQALRIYARVAAAMATYLGITGCSALHLHDYHLGIIPFYLHAARLGYPALMFTIHNACYQGWLEIWDDPAPVMYEISLPPEVFSYFQHWGNFNTLKGILFKIRELGGVITTVSEGYAQELRFSEQNIYRLAASENHPLPKRVFVPNLHLEELSWVGVLGINNGLAQNNRPQYQKFFQADTLQQIQRQRSNPLFRNPLVLDKMLSNDYNYSWENFDNCNELRTLLHMECFEGVPEAKDLVFCAIGRLVPQKNFEVLLGCIEAIIHHHPNVRFVILANPTGDSYSERLKNYFAQLAQQNPNHVYYSPDFNEPLSKLIFAGSNFCIIPSRFEPCGLVDYEAAVLGCIPIIRKTGGLIKTLPYSYGYSWYDEQDNWAEAFVLQRVIEQAIEEYNYYPALYEERVQKCMQLDTSWQRSVESYFHLLRIY